jgi:enediyne biosynthesis protein E4
MIVYLVSSVSQCARRSTPGSVFQTILSLLLVLTLFASPTLAQSFDRVELGNEDYARTPSETIAIAQGIAAKGVVTMADFVGIAPIKPHGAPGVAALDYDGDGDVDLYVTNGPGTPNSLFVNLLADTGEASFVDLAASAGLAATDQDSAGVCFGDIDNDGDPDLYVLGRSEPNRLFQNVGGGAYVDITNGAGVGGGDRSAMTCSFGDVNGDGLLDLAVGNSFDMSTSIPIFIEPFALNEHNQLFVNTGGNAFVDASDASGVGAAQDITWALALVDIDQDGDADLITANDNAGIPFASMGGIDRGFVRVLKNDGAGNFTDVTDSVGTRKPGDWMGLSFADFNHDGLLDVFGTNSGDYFERFFGLPVDQGDQSSRWFLQNADGTFDDPGVGALNATPFGWGTGAYDHDLDGDSDIVFIGGLDAGPMIELSNPGSVLLNDGDANFTYSAAAFDDDRHTRRIEHGLALADLDGDGFQDLVTVSALDIPLPLIPFPFDYDSPFDSLAMVFPTFFPTGNPGEFVFNPAAAGLELGTLMIELSSGNSNRGIQVRTLGTVGLLPGGEVNRDGIGAVVRVTPHKGETAILPVLGGSSYASQHSLTQTFGLGQRPKADVEVLWPGGGVTRLKGVHAGDSVMIPELPCNPDGNSKAYRSCLRSSLDELEAQGLISKQEANRLYSSGVSGS